MSEHPFDEKTWARMTLLKVDIEIAWLSDWAQGSWYSHQMLMVNPDLYLQAVQQEITTSWRVELEDLLEDLHVDMLTWELDDSIGDAWIQVQVPSWWDGGA